MKRGADFLNLSLISEFIGALPHLLVRSTCAIILITFFWLIKNQLTNLIFKFVLKMVKQVHIPFTENLLLSFKKPIHYFFIFLGFYLAVFCFFAPFTIEQTLFISKISRSIFIILITWGIYNLTDLESVIFKKLQTKLNLEIDQVLAVFLSKFLRVVLVLIAFTIIAQEWNYDLNGLIAGLGLGGLAIALAAKDSLANIFGGMVILLDKPFTLNDWISTSQVEGTVEEIGFRSTKIRTFTQALVTVPNSTLADEAITNWSKRGKRRIDFELTVSFDTSQEKLTNCLQKLKQMLKNHPEIHQDAIYVHFRDFGENGFQIYFYFFTITTVFREFLHVREDVNYKILQILEAEGIKLAYPSRNLYLKTLPESNLLRN